MRTLCTALVLALGFTMLVVTEAQHRKFYPVSMATENCTLLATENCTLRGETSRAEWTFSG